MKLRIDYYIRIEWRKSLIPVIPDESLSDSKQRLQTWDKFTGRLPWKEPVQLNTSISLKLFLGKSMASGFASNESLSLSLANEVRNCNRF